MNKIMTKEWKELKEFLDALGKGTIAKNYKPEKPSTKKKREEFRKWLRKKDREMEEYFSKLLTPEQRKRIGKAIHEAMEEDEKEQKSFIKKIENAKTKKEQRELVREFRKKFMTELTI